MLLGKRSATSHSVAVNWVNMEAEKEALPLPPSLISPRQQARGALATGVLNKVQFEKIQDGKVTPIARHLLSLTDSDCAAIESALLERDAAEIDQQMALNATITEQSAESVIIDLPDDVKARHAISIDFWKTVRDVVGTRWAEKMLGARPEFLPRQVRRRLLTLRAGRKIRTRLKV